MLVRAGKPQEAIAFLEHALDLQPTLLHIWRLLSRVQADQGNWAEATSALRKGLAVSAYDAPAANALAWLLATYPEATAETGAEAVELAQRALDVGRPSDAWAYLDTLAAAYARVGDFEQAVVAVEQALRRVKRSGRKNIIVEYSEHLQAFKDRQPISLP